MKFSFVDMIKPGVCELVAAIIFCAASVGNGVSWLSGLLPAVVLMSVASLPVVLLNYRALPHGHRARLISCVILPYSTFLVVLPRILIFPIAEQAMSALKESENHKS